MKSQFGLSSARYSFSARPKLRPYQSSLRYKLKAVLSVFSLSRPAARYHIIPASYSPPLHTAVEYVYGKCRQSKT